MRIWASPVEGLGFVTILLFLVGTINVFSASFVLGSQLLCDSLYFLKRHFAATLIGLQPVCIILIAAIIDRRLPSFRGLAGTGAAVAGTALLFLR